MRFISKAKAAKIIGISRETLYTLINNGKFDAKFTVEGIAAFKKKYWKDIRVRGNR